MLSQRNANAKTVYLGGWNSRKRRRSLTKHTDRRGGGRETESIVLVNNLWNLSEDSTKRVVCRITKSVSDIENR